MQNPTVHRLLKKITDLPRDKSDTLLLVLTSIVVLAPFTAYTPLWVNIAAGILTGWRIWITLRGHALPEKWQINLVACALVIGAYLHFHTWLGKDAGITFLVLLVCLKMLELNARRDAVAVLFVCYFLLVGQLLFSQNLLTGLYLLFCTALLISTQFSFQYHLFAPPLSKRLMSGFKIVGLAIPLALILFLFFPRIQGPLWGKQQSSATGITGLSDFMEPGNVAELALSDQIAFRVQFKERTPPSSQLYWRGIVLDTFNGRRWSIGAPPALRSPVIPATGTAVTQDIILEPHNQRWLFGLDQPQFLSSFNGTPISFGDNQYGRLTRYGEMRSPAPVSDRVRYSIVSAVVSSQENNAKALPLSLSERMELQNYALQLPAGFNPQTLLWAQQLRQQSTNPVQLANLVLHYFRDQPFRYTLDPPELGINQIDDFLFSTRAGFCEHYASAFVVIMRDMNIPARVITGYQGGESNRLDHWMTIRQSDAHAWAEIWVEQRGWIRVDPTAAVAPSRVEQGINGSFPNRRLSGLLNFSQQSWVGNFTRQLREQWDAINSGWNLWVLNYNLGKQLNLLSFLSGIENPQAAQLGMAMMIAASLVVGLLSLFLVVRKPVTSPLERMYQKFCRHLRLLGYPRLSYEGACDYSQRLQAVFPDKSELVEFLILYSECRYGRGYNAVQLSTLNQLLSLCLQLKAAHGNSTLARSSS